MKSIDRPSNLLAAVIVASGLAFLATSGDTNAAARPGWLDKTEYVQSGSVSVVVFLETETLAGDIQGVAAPSMTRSSRIKAVSNRLKAHRSGAGDAVQNFLRGHAQGAVERFWIVPAFKATLSVEDVEVLAAMPGVSGVVPDIAVEAMEPVAEAKASMSPAAASSGHVRLMNVPSLWAQGITGVGRLVCSFDTGVEEGHPALSGNWRGNHATLASSWFSTITPNALPTDKAGHGSHTMGIMVGIEGTDTIGVAPGAEWITAGVVDQGKSLTATFADILLAFQWALDPDRDPNTTDDVPDVILNSWGVPASLFTPCDQTFFAAIDNVEAAGIVCIFSAGNEGPTASSLRNPASRATSPLNAFSVGAVDNSKVVASFSSRGPGGCGLTEIKPEIVAPGVNVRSVNKDGGYKLMTGTSMAAPFIAGLVALCRQYNPDATVEEIKWAIIHSCEDLGSTGEDNAYGYGLPDASAILDYLSSPDQPHFRLAGYSISGDGVALPGETFDLRVTLTRTTGLAESVTGILVESQSDLVSVLDDTVGFYFGTDGTISIGYEAFSVCFDSALIHGDSAAFTLLVTDETGQACDTLSLTIPVGYRPNGVTGDFDNGLAKLTVSDFGQYGLAAGSIYNLGGLGFKYGSSANLLYEAGLVLGRSALQVSSSVRGENGGFTPSDFAPDSGLSDEWEGEDGALYRSARFSDINAEVSIPVSVSQYVADYSSAGDQGIVVLRYRLINTSLTTMNDLYFGFLSDFDLSGGTETATFDASLNLLAQSGDSGPMIGVVGLSGLPRHQTLANETTKVGFSGSRLFELISSATNTDLSASGDLMSLVTGGPYSLAPGDSIEVALALVAGGSLTEVRDRAAQALTLYLRPTDVTDPASVLPAGYELYQNYPNPFNPTTTIAFDLPASGEATLEVFNLLGQRVKRIFSSPMDAGTHRVEWDGCDDGGRSVASGVYFYRLTTDAGGHTRKMVLLR